MGFQGDNIAKGRHAAGSNHLHAAGLGQRRRCLHIDACELTVPADIGKNNMFNTGICHFYRQFDCADTAAYAPALNCYLAVFGVDADHDLPREFPAGLFDDFRVADR